MLFHNLRYRENATRFVPIFVANLFISFHYALYLYIDSSFLEQFFTKTQIGLIYVAGSILSLTLLLKVKPILRRIRTWKLIIIATIVEFIATGVFIFSSSPFILILGFILGSGAIFLILFCLDLFLEAISKDVWTGSIRTEYLTFSSFTIMLGPLAAGTLITYGGYRLVYAISTAVVVPFFILIYYAFNRARAIIVHPKIFPKSAYDAFRESPALYNIYFSRFLLSFFFCWMIIYTPIYLNQYSGLSWSDIGIVFTVMLLPFVLFQIPAGMLADKKYGEKEMLILGYVIMGVFTLVIPFIPFGASLVLWAAILFMTRVGASLVEAMTETYFFKHVDVTNDNLIGFFRTTDPLSNIAGPLLAILALTVTTSFSMLFVLLGLICFTGVIFANHLRDTK